MFIPAAQVLGIPNVGRQLVDGEAEYIQRERMEPFAFTFGSGQAFPNGIVLVWGRDWNDARSKMHDLFGAKWSFQYVFPDIAEYAQKYEPAVMGEYVADL